jgi:hypothetical protein
MPGNTDNGWEELAERYGVELDPTSDAFDPVAYDELSMLWTLRSIPTTADPTPQPTAPSIPWCVVPSGVVSVRR